MRSTTLVVWFAAAVALCGLLFSTPAMAQPDIVDASVTLTFQNGGGLPDTLDSPLDSLVVSATVQVPTDYCDTVKVVLDPQPGLGIIPAAPVTYACTGPIANITGYLMQVVSTSTIPGYCVYNVRLAVRPEGICLPAGTPVTFKIAARGVDATPPPGVPTCADQSFTKPLPVGLCLGCGYIRFDEVCGIEGDGIAAINDTMWLDTVNVATLDAQIHALEQTDRQLLENAVEFCLSNKTYSMKDLADTYRFYKGWSMGDIPSLPSELPPVGRKHGAATTISVAQRGLDEYTALIHRPVGELS